MNDLFQTHLQRHIDLAQTLAATPHIQEPQITLGPFLCAMIDVACCHDPKPV